MDAFDEAQAIQQLLAAVLRLMRVHPREWFSWRRISREHSGTEDFAASLAALSELPSCRRCFARHGDRVILTEEGIRRAGEAGEEPTSVGQRAARAVLAYARDLRKQRLNVSGVSTLARTRDRFVQGVDVELDEALVPSETPVELRPDHGGAASMGRVVGQEADGGRLYVAFETEVLPEDLPAGLLVDRGHLLHQLSRQLDRLPAIPPLASPMFTGPEPTPPARHPDSAVIAASLADCAGPWMRFLWGPPGSGKTFALGRLAAALLQRRPAERILVVAPSNRAVDVALEEVLAQVEGAGLGGLVRDRKILRFGYPRLPQVLGRSELLGPAGLDRLSEEVRRLAAAIARAERTQQPEADIALLRAQVLSTQGEIKASVGDHVRESRVVATTTTLGFLESSPVASAPWDTILVDEVTMIPLAVCVYFASRAQRRLLLAGDPRQLGPVTEVTQQTPGNVRFWLAQDVFEAGRVATGKGEFRTICEQDGRLAQITSQRRCVGEIWGQVSVLYPRIQSAVDATALKPLIDLPPLPGRSVVILDTGVAGPVARCAPVQHSWENRYSAELAMEVGSTIAAEAPPGTSIAIISPYRAQNRLLRGWIRGERPVNRALETLDVGTVHQFQGSAADVVIFDLVDGNGRDRVGALLQGDTGLRLVNVAITRARAKLVVLADRVWFGRRLARSENPLLYDLLFGEEGARLWVSPPADGPDAAGCESPIEVQLFAAMMARPLLSGVQKQHVIRNATGKLVSRADFAFPDLRYAVYCDGRQWHVREDRWQRDLRQRNELTALGWRLSVFSGSEVYRDAAACAEIVEQTVCELLRKAM